MHPKSLPHPVYCRVQSSDIYEYVHHLGHHKNPLPIPFSPQFIVDAGANVGFSALRFATDYPDSTVVAIEPFAGNVAQIRKNCGANYKIKVEHAALWHRGANLAIKSTSVDFNAFQVVEDPVGNIRGLSISDIMKLHSLPRIDLLKIDIEGSERQLFEASETQQWLPHVRMMLIEPHDRMLPGCTDAIAKALNGKFELAGRMDESLIYRSKRESSF